MRDAMYEMDGYGGFSNSVNRGKPPVRLYWLAASWSWRLAGVIGLAAVGFALTCLQTVNWMLAGTLLLVIAGGLLTFVNRRMRSDVAVESTLAELTGGDQYHFTRFADANRRWRRTTTAAYCSTVIGCFTSAACLLFGDGLSVDPIAVLLTGYGVFAVMAFAGLQLAAVNRRYFTKSLVVVAVVGCAASLTATPTTALLSFAVVAVGLNVVNVVARARRDTAKLRGRVVEAAGDGW